MLKAAIGVGGPLQSLHPWSLRAALDHNTLDTVEILECMALCPRDYTMHQTSTSGIVAKPAIQARTEGSSVTMDL
eukprot:1794243-Amphidinium_carterae.1